MRFRNGFLAGEMFVSRDLVLQLVLFNTAGIAGRFGRSGGVLANFVFEVVWQSETLSELQRLSACRPTGRMDQMTK